MNVILHVRVQQARPETESQLLTVLAEIAPAVQVLPRDGALLSVGGALRYWRRTPEQLADLVQTRLLAQAGLLTSVGGGPTRMIATMAVDSCPPGSARIIASEAALAFLHRQPLRALPGIGPVLERALRRYGLETVADLTGLPLGTLQRIAGAAVGRQLHDRAVRGYDPRPVQSSAPAASTSATRVFPRDELDPGQQRRAVLSLVCEAGAAARTGRNVVARITLTVRYADRSETVRSKGLAEPTAHTPALAAAACQLHGALGLQRARVRSISLRADLRLAHASARQLTFDPTDARNRRIETVLDRTQARYGTHVIGPAVLYGGHRTG